MLQVLLTSAKILLRGVSFAELLTLETFSPWCHICFQGGKRHSFLSHALRIYLFTFKFHWIYLLLIFCQEIEKNETFWGLYLAEQPKLWLLLIDKIVDQFSSTSKYFGTYCLQI